MHHRKCPILKVRTPPGRPALPGRASKSDLPSAPSARHPAPLPSPAKPLAGSQSPPLLTRTIRFRTTAFPPLRAQTADSRFHELRVLPHIPHSFPRETVAAPESVPPAAANRPETSPRKSQNADSLSKLACPPRAPISRR